jgi:sugar phosphate isomerase/epimerase
MQLQYVCTHWGKEEMQAAPFIDKVLEAGYDGIEINFPEAAFFREAFESKLHSLRSGARPDFIFIAQQVLTAADETAEEYTRRMKKRLNFLTGLRPCFINSHTGRDHFSFDDNCRIIEAVQDIACRSGIRILHETHRGRFSFHAASLLPYLEKFPEMELVADFSHWCTVSESLLQDQLPALEKIIPHVAHIHARVGFEQGPQVNNPFAPEWKNHLETFIQWWKQIITHPAHSLKKKFTICPEFGPAPYMPALPFSCEPTGDQWAINAAMKDLLKKEFHHHQLSS